MISPLYLLPYISCEISWKVEVILVWTFVFWDGGGGGGGGEAVGVVGAGFPRAYYYRSFVEFGGVLGLFGGC